MKTYIYVLVFLLCSNGFAGHFEIQAPCSGNSLISVGENFRKINLGEMTVSLLDEMKLEYLGNKQAIVSILDTPYGQDAIEIISPKEMKVYGWCFSINDEIPDTTADQIVLRGSENIKWFYGHSRYQNGVWDQYCTPAFINPPQWLCAGQSKYW